MKIDIINAIRTVEARSYTNYKAIGGIVNTFEYNSSTKQKDIPRGVALGVWQALPLVWREVLRSLNIEVTADQEELFTASEALTKKRFNPKSNSIKFGSEDNNTLVSNFKNSYANKITKILPPTLQDKGQIQYMLERIRRYNGSEIEWRALVLANLTGHIKSIDWFNNSSNLERELYTSNEKFSENAARYIKRAGLDPLIPGYVKKEDAISYFKNYVKGKELDIIKSDGILHTTFNLPITKNTSDDLRAYNEGIKTTTNHVQTIEGQTVIGDINLYIPPSNIRVHQQNQIYSVDALRMAGNPKLVNSAPVVKVDMSFYVNGVDKINLQLRLLAAQFRQTPFTIIRNTTVRSSLLEVMKKDGITPITDGNDEDLFAPIPVALDTLTVNTIPGFPQLVQVHITALVFNHLPFTSKFKFWKSSNDAVNNSIYSIYRNSYNYTMTDVTSDSINIRDVFGSEIKVQKAQNTNVSAVTDDPAESYPYSKFYGSLLIEYQNGTDSYTSGAPVTLTEYDPDDQHINLQYYSTNSVQLRQLRFANNIDNISSMYSNINQLAGLVKVTGFKFLDKHIDLGIKFKIEALFKDIRNMVYLYQDLYKQTIELSQSTINMQEISPLLEANKIYLNSLNGPGTTTVIEFMEKLYDKYTTAKVLEGESDNVVSLENLITNMAAYALSEIHSKSPAITSQKGLSSSNLILGKGDNQDNVIAGISMTYRNKLTPVPVNGYTLPTYQHLGSGEWSISIDLKSYGDLLVRFLNDIQSSAGMIIREQLSKERGFNDITHRIEIMNNGNLLSALGVRYMVMRGFSQSNIEGSPGWNNIHLELLQDDVALSKFNSLFLTAQADQQQIAKAANVLFPFMEWEQYDTSKVLDDLYHFLSLYISQKYGIGPEGIFKYFNPAAASSTASWWSMAAAASSYPGVNNNSRLIRNMGKLNYYPELDVSDYSVVGTTVPLVYENSANIFKLAGDASTAYDIIFYDSYGKENIFITDFVRNKIMNRVNLVYYEILSTLAAEDFKGDTTALYEYVGAYDRYVNYVGEYFKQWGGTSIEQRVNSIMEYYNNKDKRSDEFGIGTQTMVDVLFSKKRLNLTKMIMIKPSFASLLGYRSSTNNTSYFNNQELATLGNVHGAIRNLIVNGSTSNYPDFALPSVSERYSDHQIMGPAFPYVDHDRDDSIVADYKLVDDFQEKAYAYMAGMTGALTANDLKDYKSDFEKFYTKFKGTIDKAQLSEHARRALPGTFDQVIKNLEAFEQVMAKKSDTKHTKATRKDILDLIKTRAIVRWYTINKVLAPNNDFIITSIDLNQENGKIDPTSVKLKIVTKGGIDERSFSDVLSQVPIRHTTGDTSGSDLRAMIKEYIKKGGAQTKEYVLDYIYQAYTEMIMLCNVEDPAAFTDFLGFTDVDSAGKRRILRETIIRSKSKGYSGSMYKAFPTVKIYFAKEDKAEWLLLDDFYNYNAIVSVDIVDSKLSATQTAIIKLNNLMNKLSSNAGMSLVSNTDTPIDWESMMLKVGAPILIRGGYGPDNSTLPILFTGAVTQIVPGEIMELTAQSWGVELTNPVDISREGMSFTTTSAERTMGSVILRILSGAKGLKHFGRWSPADIETHKISTLDQERAYWATWLTTFDFIAKWVAKDGDEKALQQFVNSIGRSAASATNSGLMSWGNPLYDNIYMSVEHETNYSLLKFATKEMVNVFSDKGQVTWKIFNQSIWDALWEIATVMGDFIVRPLPYNEVHLGLGLKPRMTLYFGPRDGYYKCMDDLSLAPAKYRKLSAEAVESLLTDNSKRLVNLPIFKFKQLISKMVIDLSRNVENWASQDFIDMAIDLFEGDDFKSNLYLILRNMIGQGLERVGGHLLEWLMFKSLYYPFADAKGLSMLLIDPWEHIKKAYPNGALDNFKFSSYYEQSLEFNEKWQVPELLIRDIKYITGARELYDDFLYGLTLAYNYDNWLYEDMGTIASKVETGNYQENMYGDSQTLRENLLGSKEFDSIFKEASLSGKTNENLYKPIVEHHFINSYESIIDNQIVATADNMFNRVEMMFPESPTIDPASYVAGRDKMYRYTPQLNPYLDPNYIRTYTSYQKNLRMNLFVHWLKNSSIDDRIKNKEKIYDFRNAMPVYTNVGNQILMNVAKPMYQGTLTIIGDPSIKPWHIIHLYDDVNQMWGPIEVEQVVHSFNPQTGFTTTITPNAVIFNRDLNSVWDTQYMDAFGSIDTTLAVAKGAKNLFGAISVGAIAKITGKWFKNLKVLGRDMTLAARGGPWAVAAYLAGGAVKDFIEAKYVGSLARAGFMAGWMPLTIVPLMYNGKPYLAGVEGAFWSTDVYSFMLGEAQNVVNTLDISMFHNLINPSNDFMVEAQE